MTIFLNNILINDMFSTSARFKNIIVKRIVSFYCYDVNSARQKQLYLMRELNQSIAFILSFDFPHRCLFGSSILFLGAN